jgi:leucyl/phenylalanyl-tRNA--protein transferase
MATIDPSLEGAGGLGGLTPDLLLRAYACGIFPMAESADDPELHWVEPQRRGIIPFETFTFSRRLARTVRSDHFTVVADADFERVIEGCAAPAPGRERTWINGPIRALYGALYRRGIVHTIEVYEAGRLVGGLYGVALGGAFFGESMFHDARDASKVALVHLVARLMAGGFQLLDTQFVTAHLMQFGAVDVSRRDYRRLLDRALRRPAAFDVWPLGVPVSGATALDAIAEYGRRNA